MVSPKMPECNIGEVVTVIEIPFLTVAGSQSISLAARYWHEIASAVNEAKVSPATIKKVAEIIEAIHYAKV